MLNRVFIVIGLLAILALGSAFIVPRFIQWGDYRGRMEELAASVMGTSVSIRGDIAFTLLPQPRLRFSDVVVGAADAPSITVGNAEAEFSLVDFLRDRYAVTKLVLEDPALDFRIDRAGSLTANLALPEGVAQSNVSIANAQIVGGRIRLADARSGEDLSVENVDGELRLGSLKGPFQFQGSGTVGDTLYQARINSSSPDEAGASRVSGFFRPADGSFSVSTEGSLTPGQAPHFEGTLTLRQTPPKGEGLDAARGDLVLDSQVSADLQQVVFKSYTLVPDENRAGTRLTGAASVSLGLARTFQAVISGGVLGLPPRDATEDQSKEPYELVRLMSELPAPTIIPLPGTLNVDIAEVNLRALSLRDVRLDAISTGKGWRIDNFTARLPGDSSLSLQGDLAAVEGRPRFTGQAGLQTRRLDALAQLWRTPEQTRPLVNMPAEFSSSVSLDGDQLDFKDLRLSLEGATNSGSATLAFGPERRLDLNMDFAALTPAASTALMALLPDLSGGGAFAVSFPQGTLAVQAQSATLLGLAAQNLAAEASWEPNGLKLERLAADDLGGIGFELNGALSGTLGKPLFSASGNLRIASGSAPALGLLYQTLGTPADWQSRIANVFPADLAVDLSDLEQGGQHLAAKGKAAGSDLDLDANLGGGLLGAFAAPVSAVVKLSAPTGADLSRQLGLGDGALLGEGKPVGLMITLKGNPAEALDAEAEATSAGERLGFSGKVTLSNPEAVTAQGNVSAAVADGSGVVSLLAGTEFSAPALEGQARVAIDSDKGVTLTGIDGKAAGQAISGNLQLDRAGGANALSGNLKIGALELGGLLGAAGPGAAANLEGGLWPDGPFDLGPGPRQTTGTVHVSAPVVTALGRPLLADAGFDFAWDKEAVNIRGMQAALGGGRVQVDVGLCCSGPVPDKLLSGRVSLAGVALDAVLPPAPASVLDGLLDFGVQFQGSGSGLAAAITDLSGEGSYTLHGLSLAQLDPQVFPTVAKLPNLLDLPPDALTGIASMALQAKPFTAPEVSGPLTLASGTVRAANMAVEGPGGRLFGSGSLHLSDLGLSGSFALTPVGLDDPNGLLNSASSQITAGVSGTLLAPQKTIDLRAMLDAVQLRANELELDRLDALRQEDEARSRAAAEERNRLAAEQVRQRQAEDAAKKAEQDRLAAAQAEVQRKADEQAAQRANPAPATRQGPPTTALSPSQQPLNLTLPPLQTGPK